MNFYALLEAAITSSEMALKEEYTEQCLAYCTKNRIEERESFVPKNFERPSYAGICRIVDPRALPSRKDFGTPQGLATLVHAVAHIEYSAIDLALDAVYRYLFMPLDYKCDWLEVAADEVRHFKMLEGLLVDLGYNYGDFPVHSGLFDASVHTAGDILDRMAVIPRYYEASGLDVNPQIVKKLQNQAKNPTVSRIIEALGIIETEEIDHVRKGDRWFRWLCEQRGLDVPTTFQEILDRYALHRHKPHMNVEARKEAGFACEELLALGARECE